MTILELEFNYLLKTYMICKNKVKENYNVLIFLKILKRLQNL